jgi:hypothetical protein
MATVEDVVIQTVKVEIKTIVVGGKKMTLSVYKQIPEDALVLCDYIQVSEDEVRRGQLQIRGTPLGRINISGSENHGSNYMNVIYIRGGTLLKQTNIYKYGYQIDKEQAIEWGHIWSALKKLPQLYISV